MRLYYVQTVRTYCTTNSTSRHQLLLKILQMIRTQTTAVSLLQPMVIGDSRSAPMNTVLFVSQVSDRLRYKNIGFIPPSLVLVNMHCNLSLMWWAVSTYLLLRWPHARLCFGPALLLTTLHSFSHYYEFVSFVNLVTHSMLLFSLSYSSVLGVKRAIEQLSLYSLRTVTTKSRQCLNHYF